MAYEILKTYICTQLLHTSASLTFAYNICWVYPIYNLYCSHNPDIYFHFSLPFKIINTHGQFLCNRFFYPPVKWNLSFISLFKKNLWELFFFFNCTYSQMREGKIFIIFSFPPWELCGYLSIVFWHWILLWSLRLGWFPYLYLKGNLLF